MVDSDHAVAVSREAAFGIGIAVAALDFKPNACQRLVSNAINFLNYQASFLQTGDADL